jgi:predicted nucleotidyltransferase
MTPSEREALQEYVAAVRGHYGARVVDVLLFGSRARGDARPDSDADVAVILQDGDWDFWEEKWTLAGLAYDILLDRGLFIQPWPIPRSAWELPATHQRRALIEEVKKDGLPLMEPA